MRREAWILGSLALTDVPHARLIAACLDESILGSAFYLMEPVEGFNVTLEMPDLYRDHPNLRGDLGFALIDGLTALGRVNPTAVGLTGFGHTEDFLARQVQRWAHQLSSYGEYPDWAGPASLPNVNRVADWLTRHCPQTFRPGILHGDYHLANVIFRRDRAELAAIVDWELATLGDPLLDLGWVLATWPKPDGSGGAFDIRPWEGFPVSSELIARYAIHTSRDLSAIEWYEVLACYKLGILQEGSKARSTAGKLPIEVGDRLHSLAVQLFERALTRIR